MKDYNEMRKKKKYSLQNKEYFQKSFCYFVNQSIELVEPTTSRIFPSTKEAIKSLPAPK